VINDHLSVGELVAFNSYLLIGMAPLLLLGNILTMASRSEASAQRVWELLDTEPFVQISESPHRADEVQGRLNFSDVSFRYDGVTREDRDYLHLEGDAHSPLRGKGGRRVLHDISFSVEPGQRVALLGSTGSGKSTLVNLIPRFYDTTGGQITIDGVNVRDWEPEVLRAHIGMVLQQTVLFSGTVCENIAYGRPDATMEEVIAAAKAAQAHDFISALPLGYRSPVEERGANFSGGQKQRVAIARALLVSPGILVLDDSTSAVDIETEALIQKALDNVKDRCTTFIVAQRISSVLNADKIIVLEDGRIAAQGTHPQLLGTSPIYREIYNSQLGDDHLERGLPA